MKSRVMGSGSSVVVLVYFVVIGVILLRLLVLLRISDLCSVRRSGDGGNQAAAGHRMLGGSTC